MANNNKKKKSGSKKNNSKNNVNKNRPSAVKNTNVKSKDVTKKETPKKEISEKVEEKVEKKASVRNDKVDAVREKKVEAKRNTINKAKRELVYADSGENEVAKLIKVVLIVTAVIIVFYFVTSFVTKKANSIKSEKSKQKATIQYDSLIIGSMLNKDGEYYVLIEKDDDEHLSEYSTSIQMIGINENAPKVYTANLTDSFNSGYLSNEANYDSDLTKFKVKDTTLLKVNNHQIEETFDNYDAIKSKLESLQ